MMCAKKIFLLILGAVILSFEPSLTSEAQLYGRFGKNKVHYKDFQWATRTTDHFTFYFYRGEEQLAYHAQRMAERAYQYLASTLQHQFSKKIPLILYGSSDDFQQTEIIGGFIGEGIGGVTEGLKGRMVIPFLGSYRGFNHVVIHELVHAFQFDMFRNGEGNWGGLSSGFYVPLWFMEGMAEYLSEYVNPLTDMWLRDAVSHDTLPDVKEIDSMRDIRVYRFGQSLFHYLCEQYGEPIIGDLLRELSHHGKWKKSIKEVANTSWEAVYTGWLEMVRETYGTALPGALPIQEQAKLLVAHDPDEFSLNIIPSVSPDGRYVAFLSDRDLYRTIYLASAETGQEISALVEGERRGTFETLRFLNTSIAWAPDSRRIAFNAKAGGENAIYLMDVASRQVLKKMVPLVTSLSFLAWSPDNTHLAFTGIKNGQEDLFLLDLTTEEMVQLTNDLFANRHPAWSPDGQRLVFTTDAGNTSDPAQLKFGPSNVAIYDIASGRSALLIESPANDFTPVWSPDGSVLAFLSDRNGIYNIYLAEVMPPRQAEQGYTIARVVPFTNVTTGIVGLTEDNPALTWASSSGTLLFSGFDNRGWNLFSIDQPHQTYRAYLSEVGFNEEQAISSQPLPAKESLAKKDWHIPLSPKGSTESAEYAARLTPEYFLGGGAGSDEGFLLVARLGLSDMLANHRLTIGLDLTEVFDESDFLIAYTNLARRLIYELSIFQYGDESGTYSLDSGDLELEVQRGIGLNFHWPLDKFKRFEFGVTGMMVSGDRVDGELRRELDDQFWISPSLAYVHDTSLYTAFGPLDGKRDRVSLHPALGDFTYVSLGLDLRRYLWITRRSTLAFRLLGVASFGENARIFEIGGPHTFRAGSVDLLNSEEGDDTIEGTRIVLGNIEYRFPLLPKVNILRGNIFWDMALGWTDSVQPFTSESSGWLRLKDLRAAYGIGLRIPLTGPFSSTSLRFDFAQETELSRNIGQPKFLFSLGTDF